MTSSDPSSLTAAGEPRRNLELSGVSSGHGGPLTAATATSVTADDGTRLELVEEQLEARAQPVQIGEVVIRKQVVTETRTVQVPIQREELVIERRAVDRRPADQPGEQVGDAFQQSLVAHFRGLKDGESIRLPLIEEEVVIQKRPVVYEEVLIGKRALQEVKEVSGTVQREELKVTRQGEVEVSHVRRGPSQPGEGLDART